jgi:hypothetical protein
MEEPTALACVIGMLLLVLSDQQRFSVSIVVILHTLAVVVLMIDR